MGNVRDIINDWLPEKYKKYSRVSELIDSVAQLFEEMHVEISTMDDNINVDLVASEYLENLEKLFNVPQKIRTLNEEQRKYFLNRITNLIQLNGIEASINLISGLLGIAITYKALWSNDSYTTFSELEISEGFISSHINIDINWSYAGVDYIQQLTDFVDYFNSFRGVDIVVENVFATIFVNTFTPKAGAFSYGGVSARVYPVTVIEINILETIPSYMSTTMIGVNIEVFP